jgi:hypothetical protein
MNKQTIIIVACVAGSLLASTADAQVKPPKTTQKKVSGQTTKSEPDYPRMDYFDTTHHRAVSKEITYELPAEKGATIQINNTICNLDIRPWAEEKVMIVTTITVEEKLSHTLKANDEWLEAGGISVKSFGNRVDIQSRDVSRFEVLREGAGRYKNESRTYYSQQQLAELDRKVYNDFTATTTAPSELILDMQDREYWNVTGRSTKTMTIFVPEASKLDIINKNTAILINANIGTASFKLSHSNLDARNFKKLTVIGEYYNINISDVNDAELELENGTFTAGVINLLDLDSENSEIEYESGTYIYMRSQSDRLTIDQVSKVDGRKLYGELRIGQLLGSLDIEGTNADIKIRNIHQLVEKVKVTDKYADLRFPLKSLTNYAVSFHGESSTVFAPFEKIPVPVEKTTDKEKVNPVKPEPEPGTRRRLTTTIPEDEKNQALFHSYNKLTGTHSFIGETAPVKFTASAGNTTGKHTKFEIVCHQCSVDFK